MRWSPLLLSLAMQIGIALACAPFARGPAGASATGPGGARRPRMPQMPPGVGAPLAEDGEAGVVAEEEDWPEDDPAYDQAPLHTEELVFAGSNGRPARAYLSVHKAEMATSNKGIILLADIFGWASPSTRAAADRLAASCEAFVIVPDVFRGQPWPEATPPSGPAYERWRDRFSLQELAGDVRGCAQLLNTVHSVELLGLAGFCWGGGRALELVARDWVDAHAVAVFYPTRFDLGAIAKNMHLPLLAVYGGEDTTPGATPTDAAGLEGELACNPRMRYQYFVRSFPGRSHAFAHRPQNDEEAQDADDALKLAEAWFDKYLHVSLLGAQPEPPKSAASA